MCRLWETQFGYGCTSRNGKCQSCHLMTVPIHCHLAPFVFSDEDFSLDGGLFKQFAMDLGQRWELD
jgi:hypothetical protein